MLSTAVIVSVLFQLIRHVKIRMTVFSTEILCKQRASLSNALIDNDIYFGMEMKNRLKDDFPAKR
tara:strand:- start:2372 stop:2566 length:195 start_codon:yes stop_codon:yes gene_type:complete